jgi:hypothetical protein
MIVGLQYVKQLCVPEFNTVEMEVTSLKRTNNDLQNTTQ